MRYLIYFKPSETLSKKIKKYQKEIKPYYEKIKIPIHCSLLWHRFDLRHEKSIISSLKEIQTKPFQVKTNYLDFFDKNCLVIKLNHTKSLLDLHQNILTKLKQYSKKRFSYYFGKRYNPHITICQLKENFDLDVNKKKFAKYTWQINEFYLAKKETNKWKTIQKFYLQAPL